MSKNVKMLFALLATAAVMVGASFAMGIDTPQKLIDGNANETVFTLSHDIIFNAGSKDEYILHAMSDDIVTLNLNRHEIAISSDGTFGTLSSDVALLSEDSMDMSIKDGTITMEKPLFGSKNPTKEIKTALLLDGVVYNGGKKPVFYGSKSYDVTVNFVGSDIYTAAGAYLVSGDGYSFSVDGETTIIASLDFVESKDLYVSCGAKFSDPKIVDLLSGDKYVYASFDEDTDLYVVYEKPGVTVETSKDLKDALSRNGNNTVILSNNITADASLDVYGVKSLNLNGNLISLSNNASFVLNPEANLTVYGGSIEVKELAPMFVAEERASLTISGDMKLSAVHYIEHRNDGTLSSVNDSDTLGDIKFINGAKLWFDTADKATEFADFYLAAKGQKFEGPDKDNYWTVTNKSSGSSSGCNAGFAALALLALAFIPLKKSK
ncbi:MAG: Synerg-CTERM sorting domain-containing protein [Synergistes sp.]|nr:Synerg-CTERM sorting domain-containing protein [Synergistes sp.]